jgi:hypothetical protein
MVRRSQPKNKVKYLIFGLNQVTPGRVLLQ